VSSLTKELKPYFGTIMVNSILVDGKANKMDQVKKLVMVLKSFLINIFTKASL